MPKPRSLKKDAEIAVIPGNPLVLRGARNVRTLSAAQNLVHSKRTPKSQSFPATRSCFAVHKMPNYIGRLYRGSAGDWEKYGTQILELMREKFPDLYFASIVKLAQIVRIEADVSLKEPKPRRCYSASSTRPRRTRIGSEENAQDQRRARRWFVLSAMRSSRSISKLTGRNTKVTCYGCAQVTALQDCDRTKTLTHHSGMQGARNSPAISMR